MNRYIDEFISYLKDERGYSPNTVRAYRKDLEAFHAFAGKDPPEVDITDIRGFVASRIRDGKSKTSVSRSLAALRTYFSYLYREGYIKLNPARFIPSPKKESRLPRFLSIDEIFGLVERPGDFGFVEIRDRAILELFYSSGLRVGEMASLKVEDLNLRDGLLKVMGKGRKERIIPLGGQAADALKRYLVERSLLRGKSESLFLNRRGGPLTDRSIRRIVVKYARLAGLEGKISPHTLRHTFATHLLHEGADLRDIQELLGHSSLSSTQVYTHLDLRKLVDVYDSAHPLARWKGKKGGNS
jgi:integrase/recombinase XerC